MSSHVVPQHISRRVRGLTSALQPSPRTLANDRRGALAVSTPDALLVRDILACPTTLDPCDGAAKLELIGVVADQIRELPDAERRVVTMYYREGLLLREIGAVLGVTESRVSQIHSRALGRLQDMLRNVQ